MSSPEAEAKTPFWASAATTSSTAEEARIVPVGAMGRTPSSEARAPTDSPAKRGTICSRGARAATDALVDRGETGPSPASARTAYPSLLGTSVVATVSVPRRTPGMLAVAAVVVAALGGAVGMMTPAQAGAIAVTTTLDEHNNQPPCSLREAIRSANT